MKVHLVVLPFFTQLCDDRFIDNNKYLVELFIERKIKRTTRLVQEPGLRKSL